MNHLKSTTIGLAVSHHFNLKTDIEGHQQKTQHSYDESSTNQWENKVVKIEGLDYSLFSSLIPALTLPPCPS